MGKMKRYEVFGCWMSTAEIGGVLGISDGRVSQIQNEMEDYFVSKGIGSAEQLIEQLHIWRGENDADTDCPEPVAVVESEPVAEPEPVVEPEPEPVEVPDVAGALKDSLIHLNEFIRTLEDEEMNEMYDGGWDMINEQITALVNDLRSFRGEKFSALVDWDEVARRL